MGHGFPMFAETSLITRSKTQALDIGPVFGLAIIMFAADQHS